MENLVRKTTFDVVKKSRDVKINRNKIQELAGKWIKTEFIIPSWPEKFHLETKIQQQMLDYLILLDAINFCFWPIQRVQGKNKKERWVFTYKNKQYNGYFALSLALKKFFKENPEKGNLNYFSEISFKEFTSILQGGQNLQFLEKRWQIAKEVSGVLINKYGSSLQFIKSANQKLSVLVAKIYKELPYFNDISPYNGKKIYFLKRAQILPIDIWGAFGGKGIACFKDLDYLTAFADYKVPQILRELGILEYSPALMKKIKNRILIAKNSREEIEIRSATIWAIEYLKETLKKLGKEFHSFQIDWILWNKSQKVKISTPYHLTKTIFY